MISAPLFAMEMGEEEVKQKIQKMWGRSQKTFLSLESLGARNGKQLYRVDFYEGKNLSPLHEFHVFPEGKIFKKNLDANDYMNRPALTPQEKLDVSEYISSKPTPNAVVSKKKKSLFPFFKFVGEK